jgi:hypothetical protein
MAVETTGTVQMRGDTGRGVPVRVAVDGGRLKIVSGVEEVGDWDLEDIGVHAVPDGFAIRAEGEEFVLRSADGVALAEEFGLAAATPRLARKVAAAHNPELPPESGEVEAVPDRATSNVAAIAFALAGLLVLLGGIFLRQDTTAAVRQATEDGSIGGVAFWLAFVVGGLLMVAVAFVMSLGTRWSRLSALAVVAGIVVIFGYAVSQADGNSSEFTAYGFVAGGIVVGVAVLFSGGVGSD